jgi:two-component system C4-dicarboxylate transport response regulator DctD
MLGFDVTVAASARAALSLPDLRGYALVLTDVQMPGGISGPDLLHRLREQDITVPVILATGHGLVADQARRDGCLVLQKPYDEDRLRDAVTAALQDAPAPVDGEH